MRLIARTVYRAFPELDPFSDDECSVFVRNATASPWRRAMRAAVNIGVIAGLVALETRLLQGWIVPSYELSRIAVLLVLVLVTIGLGALVMRDLLLRLAVRRIFGRGAACPQCGYSLGGLPVTANARVTCPECARSTDVSIHASHCVRGNDGLLRFLPGPGAQLPADRWWTMRRVRSLARWTAVAAATVLVAVAIPMTLWEVRLRRMASAADAAASTLPPGAEALRAATPAAAEEAGDNAIDGLSSFGELLAKSQDSQLRFEISNWSSIWWFGVSRVPVQGQQALPLVACTRVAAVQVPAARAGGLIDALERISRSTAIRFAPDDPAEPSLLGCIASRNEALSETERGAANLAALWMLDACERQEPVEAARAFRALTVLCSVRGLAFPHLFSGQLVGPAQLLEHLAAVSRLPGGDEALRIARQALDQNLRCRFSPESIAALETRKFREEVIRTFRDPAVLRWRVFPWVRTRAYENAIGFRWGRGAPTTQDPSALAFDFENEWSASSGALQTELLAHARRVRWDGAAASPVPSAPLPPIASAYMAWLPRWMPGVDITQLADVAVVCVLGIEEFRRTNDRLPASLGELVPKFLPVPPPRPLGLVYRTTNDLSCPLGYQLYSMAFDGFDDGCDPTRDYPIVGAPVDPSKGGDPSGASGGASAGSAPPDAAAPPN